MTTADRNPADEQEQDLPVTEEPPGPDGETPDDAPEADVQEQRLEVPLDEEDAPIG